MCRENGGMVDIFPCTEFPEQGTIVKINKVEFTDKDVIYYVTIISELESWDCIRFNIDPDYVKRMIIQYGRLRTSWNRRPNS